MSFPNHLSHFKNDYLRSNRYYRTQVTLFIFNLTLFAKILINRIFSVRIATSTLMKICGPNSTLSIYAKPFSLIK